MVASQGESRSLSITEFPSTATVRGTYYLTVDFGVFDHLDFGGRELNELYDMRLELAEAYDRWGFSTYHVAEHHFTPLGGAPSPSVFLAAISQRTRNLRFGPLVYLFPFYHPLRLAEEICMLDQMSKGRLDVGVGRGISPVEARLYGNDPADAERMLDESQEIVLMAMSQPVITFRGELYNFENVPMVLRPYQTPYPPLWYGTTSAHTAARCARRGYKIITNATGADARAVIQAYLHERQMMGAESAVAGIARLIVVGDTDDQAEKIGNRAYPKWHASFVDLYRKRGRGPVKGERPEKFADVVSSGKAIAGSPETVTRVLRNQLAETGATYCVGQFAFGDITILEAARSVELFGAKVLPELEEQPRFLASR